ncbi:hypothetical protein P7C70_g3995, partial [Phenoliferia sp. Uapishka_3]
MPALGAELKQTKKGFRAKRKERNKHLPNERPILPICLSSLNSSDHMSLSAPSASTSQLPTAGVDLSALRAAALKSKKRKQQQAEAAVAAAAAAAAVAVADDVEMEEGEIEEDTVPATSLAPLPLYLPPSPPPPPPPQVTYIPPNPQPPPLSFGSSNVQAIREEAKEIIGQLLTFGVSAEYLMSVGISQDIVAIAFHELGFRLPPHLAHLAPPPPPHYVYPAEMVAMKSRQNSLAADPPLLQRFRSPSPQRELVRYDSPPVPEINHSLLAEMEARTRHQLMERKAALAARNAEQAQLLQDELERTLFSNFTAPPSRAESLEDYEEDDVDSSSKEVAPSADEASAATVGQLRAAVDSSDQVVYAPSGGPFTQTQLSQTRRPAPPQARRGRPIASDFVDSVYGRAEPQLVIDLSDSEDEDSDDEVLQMLSGGKSVVPTARTVLASPIPSPAVAPMTLSNVVTSANPSRGNSAQLESAGGDDTRRRLEEKEDEIKKIMERISRMEERKTKAAATPSLRSNLASRTSSSAPGAGTASPSTPRSPVASMSRLQSSVAEKTEIQEAKEHVEALEQERLELLDEVADDQMEVEEVLTNKNEEPASLNGKSTSTTDHSMALDDSVPQEKEVDLSLRRTLDSGQLPGASSDFFFVSLPTAPTRSFGSNQFPRQYRSPFEHLSLSRSLQPLPPLARPTTTSSADPSNRPQDDDAALRAWVAQRRGVDAGKRLCQYDTEGGTCSDKACKSNHVSGYRIDGNCGTSLSACPAWLFAEH